MRVNLARNVGEKENPAEERLDELYREHPDGFVAGRNELAKEVRVAGDRDEAERIRKLRRPSVAAWLINRTALASPQPLRGFEEATRMPLPSGAMRRPGSGRPTPPSSSGPRASRATPATR